MSALRKTTSGVLVGASALLLVFAARGLWLHRADLLARLVPAAPVVVLAGLGLWAGRRLRAERPAGLLLGLACLPLLLVDAGILAYFGAVAYVDARLADHEFTDPYRDCHKVWAARGLVVEGPRITPDGTQNSIESIGLAFERGARGTEVDVFYDPELGDYVVSHDRPYNLKNGELLTLGPLFEATAGDDHWFWLDFKKLRHLDPEALRGAVERLEELTAEGGLKGRVYVEGEAPLSLAAFRDAGFLTIMDTHPLPDANPFDPALVNLYKLVYYFGGFTVMAMNYGELDDPIYGPRTRESLGDVPVFVYHVEDDAEVLELLSTTDPVRVILVENHSLDRYAVNGCE